MCYGLCLHEVMDGVGRGPLTFHSCCDQWSYFRVQLQSEFILKVCDGENDSAKSEDEA